MSRCLIVLFAVVACTFAALPRSVKIDPYGSWRVVGGSPAEDGQYPHHISLKKFNSYFCGGSILNEEWILTAAHCVTGSSSNWKVVAGSNQLDKGGESYKIVKVISHPDYSSFLFHNDIALLKVEQITFNEKVQPIVLENENVAGDEDCILCGWGTISYPGNTPNDLQHISLKTTSVEQCQKAHQRPIIEEQICTLTKEGEGTCHGDSGGSLMRTVDGVRRQIGIVSWGRPCARGKPDVFTRVSSYVDWVNENCDNCAQTAN